MTNYTNTLMWKEINETSDIFSRIIGVNKETVLKVAKEIKDKKIKNIVGAGRGTSNHALVFFRYIAEIYAGMRVSFAAPSVITMYNGNIDYSDALIVGVSQSGKAADVLEIVRKGNSQGAITLAVTNDLESPLAKEAKYHLYCDAGVERSVAATKTFSATLFLLAYLVAEITGNDKMINMLGNLNEEVKNCFPAIMKETDKYVEMFKEMQSGFVLARGINYAIALEATLKLQETAYIQMKGYASSNFYHGPMAMVNSKTPVIIYAGKFGFDDEALIANYRNDVKNCVDKMKSLNAPVLVVTDDEYFANITENVAYITESCCEVMSMFKFALFAQVFACKTSCAIGNNPDSPRALKKVTITK